MENIPKTLVLAHKRAERAYKFLEATHRHLMKYLRQHNINDLYDLHKRYVPVDRYQDLKQKYADLKKTINQKAPHQGEAIVGKAKVQSDHQQPASSIINQLKNHQDQDDSNS